MPSRNIKNFGCILVSVLFVDISEATDIYFWFSFNFTSYYFIVAKNHICHLHFVICIRVYTSIWCGVCDEFFLTVACNEEIYGSFSVFHHEWWTGADLEVFQRGEAFCVDHHGWPAKKILGFRWSKKAEVTLETISFWQNISISIFKFSSFLLIKSYQLFKIY